MKTTIHVYSEKSDGYKSETSSLHEAMKQAHNVFTNVLRSRMSRKTPLCIDITTTIGNKVYQYIQVLDGSTLYVASLKSL